MISEKIGLGGGCHWCTEAVFQSLKGISQVQQGYINASENVEFSEAILFEYNPSLISLENIIRVHLKTHESLSDHSMRDKYRSAIYIFHAAQKSKAENILKKFQKTAEKRIVTGVFHFKEFRASREEIQNYYKQDPARPFCSKYIAPKLELLKKDFASLLKTDKV